MGFVELAGEDKGKIARHGLVFTGGVLVSFRRQKKNDQNADHYENRHERAL